MTGKNTSGFTLIELVIAIGIVGILASIAYPSYVDQMRQTKRTDCEAVLMQMAGAMEREFSRTNAYRDITDAPVNFGNQCPVDGGTATYILSIQPPMPAATYVLSATPAGAQAADPCGTLTLTNTLQKGQSPSRTLAECWQ